MALIYFLSLLFFLLSTSCKSSSPTCYSNYSCGHINISYPFSLYNPHDDDTSQTANSISYCGYPDLQIYCENNDTPIIYLNSDNYTITDINYPKKTVSLLDTDILNSSPSCPEVQHNISLNHDFTWLNYTNSDVNLTFFFNCDPFPSSYNEISCLDSIFQKNSYVFQTADIIYSESYDEWVDQCDQVVVTPVFRDNLEPVQLNLSVEFGPVVKKGFELVWYVNSQSCSNCEKKDGQCGYNTTSNSSFVETCFCPKGGCRTGRKKFIRKGFIIGASIGACGLLVFAFSFLLFWRNDRGFSLNEIGERNKSLNIEAALENCVMFVPKRYRFYEIRNMTKSFSEKLGQGGYGQVFKEKLFDGTLVAVKVFKDRKSNGEEFINEVASIARTSHVNIVRLLGFSMKGSKRALIYEFMPNGSLDKYLSASENPIMTLVDSTRLYEIGIGIARGLEYLHRGCNTRIIHFDIKPHNILLDQDYCPKISDFGLAKFCRPKESIISMSGMRGTIGYIAPEVFSRNFGTISSKSDVYSYGMMVLEMIGGKQSKTFEITENSSSDVYFPDNIYKCVAENTFSSVYGISDVNEEIVRKMAIVGLWCIQLLPDARPTMSRVLDMLEGRVEILSVPPKLCVSLPPELAIDSFSTE